MFVCVCVWRSVHSRVWRVSANCGHTAAVGRLQYEAAVWYRNHLDGRVAVVVLSEDAALAERCGHRQPGVFVQTVDQYLSGFWPNLTAARQIHDSVQAMLQAGDRDRGES